MLIDEVKNNQWVEDPAIEVINEMLDETATNVSAHEKVSDYVKDVLKILNKANDVLETLQNPLRLFLSNEEYDEPENGYGTFAIYTQKQLVCEDGKIYYGFDENAYYVNDLRIDEIYLQMQSLFGEIVIDFA